MADLSTVTIGLALLGFILGAVIVALANQSRMKRLEEAHGAQIRRMRDDEAKRTALLDDTHEALLRAESETRDAKRATESTQQEIEILRAQQNEDQEAAAGLEDRLNAAEALLLTLEATGAAQREELVRWNRAYGSLKGANAQLAADQSAAAERSLQLEGDLSARTKEVESLHLRLDSLQNAYSLALQGAISEELLPITSGDVPVTAESIAFARAEVQSLLRQRELELSDLRSKLSATRFSVNVLAHSGAELAAMLNQSEAERSADALEAALLRAGQVYLPNVNQDEGAESLASLEGIIGDWYREVRPMLPWSSDLLSRFGGDSVATRFENAKAKSEEPSDPEMHDWLIGEWEEGDGDVQSSSPVVALPVQEHLPTELKLATLKAATTSALQRTLKRQYELENEAARTQGELAQARESAEAWSALVTQLATEDPDVAALIPEEGDLPTAGAVITLLRSKIDSATVAGAGATAAGALREESAASQQSERGATRRTLIGWLRRIDEAVQRQPRTNE